MIAMADSIFRPKGGQSLLTDYPLVYELENLPRVQVVEADDKIVSVVPFIPWPVWHDGCQFNIGIISPTATHPDYRKRGFALKCLNSCIGLMNDQGIDLAVLWTMVPTFDFYNHAAFQGIRDQGRTYPCTRSDASLFTDFGHEATKYDIATRVCLSEIRSMHEADPHGLVRDETRWSALLSIPGLTTHLATADGKPIAYLCYSDSTNKPGFIEGGGDARAIETLMHRTLSMLPEAADSIAHSQLCETAFGKLLESKFAERRRGSGENTMIRINNVRGFLHKISDWLQRKNGDRARSFSIEITDSDEVVSVDLAPDSVRIGEDRRPEHFEMSRLDFTSVVFGPHPARPYETPEPIAQLFPFYFPITVLDRS
jgi:GNAT superfamily N-acetyltransferase